MAQFIVAGQRLINLDNVVDVRVYESGQPHPGIGSMVDPKPEVLSVVLVTTASDWQYEEYSGEYIGVPHYEIVLRGDNAVKFLTGIYVSSAQGSRRASDAVRL